MKKLLLLLPLLCSLQAMQELTPTANHTVSTATEPQNSKIVNPLESDVDIETLDAEPMNVRLIKHKNNARLIKAFNNGDEKQVKIAINNGADITIKILNGLTPLHLASQKGYLTIVTMLLKKKADVNAINHLHQTPLHLANLSNHFDIVQALLIAGADVSLKDRDGKTALELAQEKGFQKIVNRLEEVATTVRLPQPKTTFQLPKTTQTISLPKELTPIKINLQKTAKHSKKHNDQPKETLPTKKPHTSEPKIDRPAAQPTEDATEGLLKFLSNKPTDTRDKKRTAPSENSSEKIFSEGNISDTPDKKARNK